jgi:hypothetical protein
MATTFEEREKQVPPPRLATRRNDRTDVWARFSATFGAVVWAGMAVLARVGFARIGAIELMFLFAPLVVVPSGMELARMVGRAGTLHQIAQLLQPLGAALAVIAICLPPGRVAGLLACGWISICLLMAADGAIDFVHLVFVWRERDRARSEPVEGSVRFTLFVWTVAITKIDLAVGGAWLVASRIGMRPMGIQEPIELLTAVHFHFAGFATATIAAATLRFAERTQYEKWLKWIVPFVVGMPYVVALGFVISPAMKMTAALIFSLSVAALAVVLRACGRRAEQSAARVLLQMSAIAVFAGMVLSGVYAIADLIGSDVLTIPQMARTHGILNAVGFCMTGLLGWIVEWNGREGVRN